MKKIQSKVFGEIYLLEDGDKELEILNNLIDKFPANAFGIVNKKLNKLGLLSRIELLKKEKYE